LLTYFWLLNKKYRTNFSWSCQKPQILFRTCNKHAGRICFLRQLSTETKQTWGISLV